MTSSGFYPEWLATSLLQDSIDWETGQSTAIAAFLNVYSLHDSTWMAFNVDVVYEGAATAAIRWDAHWTEGRIPYPGSNVADWPILLIRFLSVSQVSLRGYSADSTIPMRGIGTAETRQDGQKAITTIADHYGGEVELTHQSDIHVLCLDPSGVPITIPGLGHSL